MAKKKVKEKAKGKKAKRKAKPKSLHAKKSQKVGRPTAYKPEYPEQAYKLCLLGATDMEMADFFGVRETTLTNWKKAHPEFLGAITRGKDMADANVASRLYERACGYEHDDVYPSNYQGEVTLTPIRKHYPPDTPAASLWLRNRQPSKWRDKQDHEHTGPGGTPLDREVNIIVISVSGKETAATKKVIDAEFKRLESDTG